MRQEGLSIDSGWLPAVSAVAAERRFCADERQKPSDKATATKDWRWDWLASSHTLVAMT